MERDKKQEIPKAHVRIFGEDADGEKKEYFRHCCRHRRHHHCTGPILGTFLLFGGAVLLLNNINLISWDFWTYAAPLWPAILVLLGIRILLGCNFFSGLFTFLVSLAVFTAIVFYGLVKSDSLLLVYVPPEAAQAVDNLDIMQLNGFIR